MTTLRKIAVPVTCVAVICGAAILWPVYKEKATERKLAEAASVLAKQGDANAQYSLGNMYRKGQGVRQDYAESVRWFREAAAQGDAKAQSGLAHMYDTGKGVSQDHAEALRWGRKAADGGDAKAQSHLASMYYYGQGVPQDYTEAVHWYRKAADQGYAMALEGLAYMYDTGKGIPQDHAEAFRWYRKAADQGDAPSQSYLGFCYFRGQGVPQDYAEAFRWYRKAADRGDSAAQSFLSVSYFKGRGVPRNYIEAIHWFGKVAASCFARTERGPLARGTFIVGILLALPVLVVPRRRWGRALWLSLALVSAVLAAAIAHELSILALLPRGLVGTLSKSPGRVLWLALIAGVSVMYAIAAVVEARRGSKRSGDQGQPPTPPEGSLESPT